MTSAGLRVCMITEQLMQPVPGGIGEYTRALMRYLPHEGVQVEPVVAWHSTSELARAGLSHARRLRVGRRALYTAWQRAGRPGVGGDAAVVHAPSLAFPRRDSRPLVITVHDTLWRDYPDAYPPQGVKFHERALARVGEADAVICPSDEAAAALRRAVDASLTIRVIPQGTDYSAPDTEERDAILDRLQVHRPYVLWMGTVEPRKNPEGIVMGFVEAVTSGVPRAGDLHLYLVGPPGWWRGEVAELVEARGLSDRVRRIDGQPRSVRAALYAGAEAFVFPSFAEGFGLPVIEAMACGCPVVTSNRSSLPEVAGNAALLCDPDDVASIGESLAKVLRDRELREDLRRLGLDRARLFTWERTARETAACYREVLAS